MKYAVIQLGSKQFRVEEGDVLELEHQPTPLKIETLLVIDGKDTYLGEPFVEKATVKATVLEEKRGKKVRIGRFKSKSRYRKVKGHRQPMSVIKIESISYGAAKKAEKTAVKEEKPKKELTNKETSKKAAAVKKPAPKKTSTKSKEEKKTK